MIDVGTAVQLNKDLAVFIFCTDEKVYREIIHIKFFFFKGPHAHNLDLASSLSPDC